ncbi:Mob1/phocein [Trametes meyenii]|nr:Mob1/phocein [Trametes meyenii]
MTATIQRPLKGSRISSFYPVKTLPPISALDSAFQLQEYISLIIRLDVHNVEKIVAIPGKEQSDNAENGGAKGDDKETDKDAAGGVNVDPACWVYEHLRRVAQDLSHPLITMLQQECTRTSCPEMKAGEWLYLCVAHGNEGAMEQCCAIDYILHTLDSATALLNSPRAFPSRLSVPATSHRHFTSLCRRLGRIFAHAYFHHREVFEQAEAESSLYARFLALVKYFDLVPLEFLVIPPRMDGRVDPVEPPRLMGAALEPRSGVAHDASWSTSPSAPQDASRDPRGKSPPGPAGHTRGESPRKFGRARTDTMVYSEAFSVAEELAKGDPSEIDMDREIAAERAAAAEPAHIPTALPAVVPAELPRQSPLVPPSIPIISAARQEEAPGLEPVPRPAEDAPSEEAENATETKSSTAPPTEPASEEPAENPEGPLVPAADASPAPAAEEAHPVVPDEPPAPEVETITIIPPELHPVEEPVTSSAQAVVILHPTAASEENVEPEPSEAAPVESTAEEGPSDTEPPADKEAEQEEEAEAQTEAGPEPATEAVEAPEEEVSAASSEPTKEPVEEPEVKETSELVETPSHVAVVTADAEEPVPTPTDVIAEVEVVKKDEEPAKEDAPPADS